MSDKAKGAGPDRSVSRREFVVGGAALVGGVALAGCLPDVEGEYDETFCSYTAPTVTPGDPKYAGRVVEEVNPQIVSSQMAVDPAQASTSLGNVLMALTGATSVDKVWSVVLPDYQPTEVVGIKVNVLSNGAPTSPVLIKQLVDMLKSGGIKSDKILVWDRRMDELTLAGYSASKLGCRLEATLESTSGKGSGQGYEFETVCIAGKTSHLTTIQTRGIDHLINVAIMKNHGVTGYTGVLKNHYGTIDNPGKFHGADGVKPAQALAAINSLDEVASKARLFILDAALGVCYGDTDADVDCTPRRVAASFDPVALDARGRQIRDLMAKPATPETKSDEWLASTEKVGLGKKEIKLESVT